MKKLLLILICSINMCYATKIDHIMIDRFVNEIICVDGIVYIGYNDAIVMMTDKENQPVTCIKG